MPAHQLSESDALRVAELLRRGEQSLDLSLLTASDYDFSGQELGEAIVYHSELIRCRFCRADLFAIDIRESKLPGADWRHAQLEQAQVHRSDLSQGRFDGAKAKGAIFVGVDLRQSSLRGTDLRRASFVGCDLRQSVLDGAKVSGATFLECRISGVSWEGLRGQPSFGAVC